LKQDTFLVSTSFVLFLITENL